MVPVVTVCVQLKSRICATDISTFEPTTGAVLNGTIQPPGPGPVAGAAVLMLMVDRKNPCQNILPALPTARTIPSASSSQGTLVCTAVLRVIARVSKPAVPPTPHDKSKRAVPGVVTTVDTRPEARIRSLSPILSLFAAIV